VYEENVHIPLLVSAPGAIDTDVRRGGVVSLLDAAPTVLDLLGLPNVPGFQGSSALDGQPRMAPFYADYSLGVLGVRDGRFKYIYELESRRARLFDLERDPGERRNIVGEERDAAAWYERRISGWIAGAP
jgi:arylsulfatase A-like enzyme